MRFVVHQANPIDSVLRPAAAQVTGTPRSSTATGIGQPIRRCGVAGIRQSGTVVDAGRTPVRRPAHSASIEDDTSHPGRSGGHERSTRTHIEEDP